MARSGFDNAGAYVQIKDLLGETVLFTPSEYIEEFTTEFKTQDVVVTDLVVLSQDNDEHQDVMIFQGSLIGALKRRIKTSKSIDRDPSTGVVSENVTTTVRRVLGVISKGEAKKGQQAPYILEAASDEYVAKAQAYHDANPVPAPVTKTVKQYVDLGNAAPAPAVAGPFAVAPAAPAPAPAAAATATATATGGYDGEDPFAV